MSALIRQMAVLSVLWALCELLLPSGRQQQMVRMTVSVLVMTALLSTAGEVLRGDGMYRPALAYQAAQSVQNSYHHTALRAAANQMSAYCEKLAQRSGYAARADVYLTREGEVDHIELHLKGEKALLSPQEIAQRIAGALQIEMEKIRLGMNGAEEP